MVPDLPKIIGTKSYKVKAEALDDDKSRKLYFKGEKVFLVENNHTIEVRCDDKLSELLQSKYESVMQSRYFGRGGIEIVPAGQLTEQEITDLIRLSYNLTK